MKVVVIGAGLGGCATAAILSARGHDVTVLEQADHVGGRCATFWKGGYRFDRGASMLMMLDCFERLGAAMGLDSPFWDEAELIRCDPNCVVKSGKQRVEVRMDPATTMADDDALGRVRDGLATYMRDGRRHYEAARAVIMTGSYDTLYDACTVANVTTVLSQLNLTESLASYARRLFRTDLLTKVFTFQSMYMGTSPYAALAAYNLLQWSELAEGIWYPRGGMGRIPERLAEAATERGARIRLSCPADRVVETDGVVTGVRCSDGSVVPADCVVCNADRTYAAQRLTGDTEASAALHAMEHGCSTISFYWGVDRAFPDMPSHQILLGQDYERAFDDIFERGRVPDDPSLYVHVPSSTDPDAAPSGHSAVIVLLPVGCEHVSGAELQAARRLVLDRMKSAGYDLEPHIVCEHVETPNTWAADWNIGRGACLGLNHTIYQMGPFRPSNRHRRLPNLFFVGASCQPGGGVPIVIHSAINVCRRVERRAAPLPWYALHWVRLRPTVAAALRGAYRWWFGLARSRAKPFPLQ